MPRFDTKSTHIIASAAHIEMTRKSSRVASLPMLSATPSATAPATTPAVVRDEAYQTHRQAGPRRSPAMHASATSAPAPGPNRTAASTTGMNATDSSRLRVTGMLRPSATPPMTARTATACQFPTPSTASAEAAEAAATATQDRT